MGVMTLYDRAGQPPGHGRWLAERAAPRRRGPRACAALLLAASTALASPPAALAAASGAGGRSVTWNAAVGSLDLRNDTAELSGDVRVWQGPTSIEAQAATGRQLSSDDSHWTFQDAVHIRTAEADLRSSSASASFLDGQIAQARVEGSPARFEQRGGEPDRQVRGRAGVIEYDFDKGIVRLSDEVWFSNGKDEFRGDLVVYDVRDERVQINPGGSASGRVRGIIRPRENDASKPEASRDRTPDNGSHPAPRRASPGSDRGADRASGPPEPAPGKAESGAAESGA